MLMFVVMQLNSSGDMMGYFGNDVNQLDEYYFLNFEPQNPNQASQVIA